MKKTFLLFFSCFCSSPIVFSCENTTHLVSCSHAQGLCKLGLACLEKSVTHNQGYFAKEVNTEQVKAGVRHLINSLKQETRERPKSPTVARNIIEFFKNNTQQQLLLMHGHVDELFNAMPHSGPADFDLTIPVFNDTRTSALPAKKHLNINLLSTASSFPCINRTNKTAAIKTDIGKKTIHLSPDSHSFTCIIQNNKRRSQRETIYHHPLDAQSFDSLCIGNARYALVNKDATTNTLNISLKSTRNFSDLETIATPYSRKIEIQLSPDEQKILCIDCASHYNKKHRVYDLRTKQWYDLDFSEFAAPHPLLASLFDELMNGHIGWNKDSNRIIARSVKLHTYSWKLPHYCDHFLTDNTTVLKAALYNHWLSSLKEQYLKELDSESIHNLRRFMSVLLPASLPSHYVTHKNQERDAFIKEYELQEIVQE